MVPVQVWYETESFRQPVAWKKVLVRLILEEERWAVSEVELVEIS